MKDRCLVGVFLTVVLSFAPLQNATSQERRVSPRDVAALDSISDSQLATAAARSIDESDNYSEQLLARFAISRTMIETGRLTAIRNNQATVINARNVADVVVPGAYLVADTGAGAMPGRVPDVLINAEHAGTTYSLGWTLISAEGNFTAWGRNTTGVIYDGPSGEFAGDFDVALTRHQSSDDRSTLTSPVAVSVSAPGATRVAPRPLQIDRLGGWHGVGFSVPRIAEDHYEVGVSANPNDVGNSIQLPVIRPTYALTASPSSIVGWGVGRTAVGIQTSGIRNPAGVRLRVASPNGSLRSSFVTLDSQGNGEVWVRSSRHAGTTLSLIDANFDGKPLSIQFEAPWLFLTLAIAGGFVGAFLRGRGRKRWVIALAVGATTGVVVALLYSLGINWLANLYPDSDIASGGEAIIFVSAVLGAYLGIGFAVKPAN